jgi:hypothetical protein
MTFLNLSLLGGAANCGPYAVCSAAEASGLPVLADAAVTTAAALVFKKSRRLAIALPQNSELGTGNWEF